MSLEVNTLQSDTFSMTGTNETVTITSVDSAKAILFASYNTDSGDPSSGMSTAILENNTTIRFRRQAVGGPNSLVWKWYVVEFTPSSDIDVQRGTLVPAALVTNITISSVGNLAEAFPMNMGCFNGGGNFGVDDDMTVQLTSVTNLQMVFNTGQGFPDGAAWQVIQSGDIAVQEVVQASTAATTVNNAISAIIDAQTSIFSNERATAATNFSTRDQFRHWLTTTTNLNSIRDSGTVTHMFIVYIVQWPSNVDVQKFRETVANAATTVNFTLAAVDITKTIPQSIASLDSIGKQAGDGGSNDLRAFCTSLEITSSTNLQAVRDSMANALYRHVQTIEFLDLDLPLVTDLRGNLKGNLLGGFQ